MSSIPTRSAAHAARYKLLFIDLENILVKNPLPTTSPPPHLPTRWPQATKDRPSKTTPIGAAVAVPSKIAISRRFVAPDHHKPSMGSSDMALPNAPTLQKAISHPQSVAPPPTALGATPTSTPSSGLNDVTKSKGDESGFVFAFVITKFTPHAVYYFKF